MLRIPNQHMAAFAQLLNPGTSLATQLYDAAKPYFRTPMQHAAEMLPEPLASLFSASTQSQDFYRSMMKQPMVLDQLELWADGLKSEGTLYGSDYNYQFLAENGDGSIAAFDPDAVISLFQPTQRNGWVKPAHLPRVLLTASHARGESLKDVTNITHGIEALARDSWGGQALNVAKADAPIGPEQTLVLFTCDTEKNPFLNGIALQRRLNELEENAAKGTPDQFEHISPGAKRMAKLMLACMCENYYGESAQGEPTRLFSIDDPRPLSELLPEGTHLFLSADAGRIAQHFQLMGYSKGGNVVSDALRYLEKELTAKHPDGHHIVRAPDGESEHHGIGKYGARGILRNIDCASMAAKEVAFSEAQQEAGFNRVAFNNQHDDLTKSDHYESTDRDEKYMIRGVRSKAGHDPVDAMGDRTKRGYALDDPRVARRLREFFAPHHGKAALGRLIFDREEGVVQLKAAPGTPDAALAQFIPAMTEALGHAGLSGVRIEGNHVHQGLFTLHASDNLLEDPQAVRKLERGIAQLRRHADGLVIAQRILDTTIPAQLAQVEGLGRAA